MKSCSPGGGDDRKATTTTTAQTPTCEASERDESDVDLKLGHQADQPQAVAQSPRRGTGGHPVRPSPSECLQSACLHGMIRLGHCCPPMFLKLVVRYDGRLSGTAEPRHNLLFKLGLA